jgi:hypothetical protein
MPGTGKERPKEITFEIDATGSGTISAPSGPVVAEGGNVFWNIDLGGRPPDGAKVQIVFNPDCAMAVYPAPTEDGWLVFGKNAPAGTYNFTVVIWRDAGATGIAVVAILIVE